MQSTWGWLTFAAIIAAAGRMTHAAPGSYSEMNAGESGFAVAVEMTAEEAGKLRKRQIAEKNEKQAQTAANYRRFQEMLMGIHQNCGDGEKTIVKLVMQKSVFVEWAYESKGKGDLTTVLYVAPPGLEEKEIREQGYELSDIRPMNADFEVYRLRTEVTPNGHKPYWKKGMAISHVYYHDSSDQFFVRLLEKKLSVKDGKCIVDNR